MHSALQIICGMGIILWLLASILILNRKQDLLPTRALFFAPICLIVMLLVYLWFYLERPPLKSLGETRLWYALLLPLCGALIYQRLQERLLVVYTLILSMLFLLLNMLHPENLDKTLPPALQSPWFVPHVIVYMVGYALLGASSIYSFLYIFHCKAFLKNRTQTLSISAINSFVLWGFAFLTFGLLFGAFWAKEAWGNYWTWDPKESWALLTWIFYLNYLHLLGPDKSNQQPGTTPARAGQDSGKCDLAAYFLAFGFIVLLLCWFGVNYMPSAKMSVHTYTN